MHFFYSATCRARYSRECKHNAEVTGIRALKSGGWSVTVKFLHQPVGLIIGAKVNVDTADIPRTAAHNGEKQG